MSGAKSEVATLDRTASDLQRLLRKFDDIGPICSKCGQDVAPEHRAAHEDELKERLVVAQRERRRKAEELASLGKAYAEANVRQGELRDLLYDKRGRITKIGNNLAEANGKIAACEVTIARHRAELEGLQAPSRLAKIQDDIESARVLIAQFETTLSGLESILSLWGYWERAFSPKGIESFGLPAILDYLEGHARRYSTEYFGGIPDLSLAIEGETIERTRVYRYFPLHLHYCRLVPSIWDVNFPLDKTQEFLARGMRSKRTWDAWLQGRGV